MFARPPAKLDENDYDTGYIITRKGEKTELRVIHQTFKPEAATQ